MQDRKILRYHLPTGRDEMDVLDSLEALLEMFLHGLGVPRLAQDLQEVVIRHEVEPREYHPTKITRHARKSKGIG